jgi:hypothetical protein
MSATPANAASSASGSVVRKEVPALVLTVKMYLRADNLFGPCVWDAPGKVAEGLKRFLQVLSKGSYGTATTDCCAPRVVPL